MDAARSLGSVPDRYPRPWPASSLATGAKGAVRQLWIRPHRQRQRRVPGMRNDGSASVSAAP